MNSIVIHGSNASTPARRRHITAPNAIIIVRRAPVRRDDWRDDVIVAQADYIAAIEPDLITYRDLLVRSWAHSYELHRQIQCLNQTVARLRAELRGRRAA